jgi:signal transduction histidine kinase
MVMLSQTSARNAAIKTNNGIYIAQIRAVYDHIPMVLVVNVVNSGLVALVLASYMEQTTWLIFFVLVIALTGVRAAGWISYRYYQKAFETATWAILATAGSALSGMLWGAASTLFLPDDIVERTFFAFVIGGMCAGALISLSYYLPAFLVYVYGSVLPLAVSFLLDDRTVYVGMGCMALVFAVALTFAANHFNRAFVRGLRLNFDLASHTEALTRQTEELTAVNSRLEAEIAQRHIAEDQLHQAQKMDALGQLTGGIAHDFNNLLTAVIGNLELAQRRADSDPHMIRLIETALGAAERGANLIRDLLTFARRQPLHPQAVDVSAVVSDAEKILKQTIGPNIRLVICAQAGLPPAWADPNQLELAILNLALNARDAMPGGGSLNITSANRRVGNSGGPADLVEGDYVVVSVADTGMGMTETTLARAFEPFFTTKEAGRGSGLGLSMVEGFAAQSGGTVRIASVLGEGTAVELWLPRAEAASTKMVPSEQPGSVPAQRGARVLVCDDDSDVRTLIGTLLRNLGHTVWEASDPGAAIQLLEGEQPLDLLLVDYAMPEMNGLAVIDRAQTCQPGIKTLLITGHMEVLQANATLGVPVLPKPFKLGELSRRIGEILEG